MSSREENAPCRWARKGLEVYKRTEEVRICNWVHLRDGFRRDIELRTKRLLRVSPSTDWSAPALHLNSTKSLIRLPVSPTAHGIYRTPQSYPISIPPTFPHPYFLFFAFFAFFCAPVSVATTPFSSTSFLSCTPISFFSSASSPSLPP